MEGVSDIKNDYRNLEKRIGKTETGLARTEIQIVNLTSIVEHNNATLDDLNKTMIKTNYLLEQNIKDVEYNRQIVKKMEENLTQVEHNIEEVDEKSKVDILGFLKKNFLVIVVFGAFVFYYVKSLLPL